MTDTPDPDRTDREATEADLQIVFGDVRNVVNKEATQPTP
jgi:hypothetical protein